MQQLKSNAHRRNKSVKAIIPRGEDYFTSSGAIALMHAVEKYWFDRGHVDVLAWIEEVSMHTKADKAAREDRNMDDRVPSRFYAVRSNLVNGLPPRVAWKRMAA